MLIPVPNMLNSGTFKHQMILITYSKITVSMALVTETLEARDALAAPHINWQIMAATPKTQKNFHGRGRNMYLGSLPG